MQEKSGKDNCFFFLYNGIGSCFSKYACVSLHKLAPTPHS